MRTCARKTYRGWMDLEVRELRDMRADGLSVRACAEQLGRTYLSVRMKVQEQRFRRRKSVLLHRWLPEFQKPHQYDQLAVKYGVRKNTLRVAKQRLKKLGYSLWWCRRRPGS